MRYTLFFLITPILFICQLAFSQPVQVSAEPGKYTTRNCQDWDEAVLVLEDWPDYIDINCGLDFVNTTIFFELPNPASTFVTATISNSLTNSQVASFNLPYPNGYTMPISIPMLPFFPPDEGQYNLDYQICIRGSNGCVKCVTKTIIFHHGVVIPLGGL